MRTLLAALFGIAAALAHGVAQEVQITVPGNDGIVIGNSIAIQGTAIGGAGPVRVKLGPNSIDAPVAGGAWKVDALAVPSGLNNIEATFAGKTARVSLTKGASISARPRQKVRFVWNAGVDEVIKQTASGTLDATLTPAQLTTFAAAVRARAVAGFLRAYGNVDIELTETAGPDVHTISLLTNSGSIFGQSPFDFGNVVAGQTSQVWVGTYRDDMVERFVEWGPMKKNDPLGTRIIDVGESLARTSAHEFGHSLGMVGSGLPAEGGWMLGCDGGHSCDQVDDGFPPANRFDQGFHIMDPGGKTLNNARLAEAAPNQRTTPRKPAVFCNFDASYLSIIHHKQ